MSMARLAFSEHRASGDVEGGEQRGGAVAHIVVGNPFHITESHRQNRLGAVEGLESDSSRRRTRPRRYREGSGRGQQCRGLLTKNGSVESLKLRVRCG